MEIPTWTIQNWQCFLNPSALHLVLERDGGHGAHLLWRRENTTALHSNSTRNILDMRAGISTLKNTSSRVHSMSLAIWNTESGKHYSAVLQNWFPQEIGSPLFNLRKSLRSEKGTAESCTMHWNLINDQVFGCFKFLKLKYKMGSHSAELVSAKKLCPPSLIRENLKKL